jgi:hypothetical protein
VGHWTWEEQTCRSLDELRGLRDGRDLANHVLRLVLSMRVSAEQYEATQDVLRDLKGTSAAHGRVGVMQLDTVGLELDTTNIEDLFHDAPDVLKSAAERLKALEDSDQRVVAQKALYHLYRLSREAR